MKENFGAEHKKILGVDIKAGGYPDTGSGVYSRNLTYEQWFAFNNAQRAHMNFVEMFGPSVVFLVAGGIYYPIPAASIGLFLIISRIVYSCSYSMGGPQQRLIGAIMNDAALLALFILSFISGIRFILDEEI